MAFLINERISMYNIDMFNHLRHVQMYAICCDVIFIFIVLTISFVSFPLEMECP